MLSDEIIEKTSALNNPSVIGLDTRFDYLPETLQAEYISRYGQTPRAASEAVYEFNRSLIDALCDIAAVVKVQIAYYEMYGPAGIETFARTCSYAKSRGMIVIADCKRNDIGSTASAYSTAYIGMTSVSNTRFKAYDTDCVTVNPYLGSDGIKPFIEDCVRYDKGIFILVKTSNNSSFEYQDKVLSETDEMLYTYVARTIDGYISETGRFGYSNIGAVIGATYPDAAIQLRHILKRSILLVPGFGAQGGSIETIGHFFDNRGRGALINSSRAILLAYRDKETDDFTEASRCKAVEMRDELNKYIKGAI